jgi:hypothetical protein
MWLVAAWIGCGLEVATIEVEDQTDTVVPGASILEQALGDLGFDGWADMDVVDQEELANQGVEPGDITEVYVTGVSLAAIDPAGTDLSFMRDLALYVEAPDLERVRVASKATFPEGEGSVALDLEPVDLADYVVSRSMTFTVEVSGHRPDDDTTVRATTTLDVGVTTRGAVSAGRRD